MIKPAIPKTFAAVGISGRHLLRQLPKHQIEVVAPGRLFVGEEVGDRKISSGASSLPHYSQQHPLP